MAKIKKKTNNQNSKTIRKPKSFMKSAERKLKIDLKRLVAPATRRESAKGADSVNAVLFYSSNTSSLQNHKPAFIGVPEWLKQKILSSPGRLHKHTNEEGINFYFCLDSNSTSVVHEKSLVQGEDVQIRELCGSLYKELETQSVKNLEINLIKSSSAAESAFSLGFELASYRFTKSLDEKAWGQKDFNLSFVRKAGGKDAQNFRDGKRLGAATNIARHLVNLPPNLLHPVSYAASVSELLKGDKSVSIQVWDEKKLEAENMGLLLAVGRGAEHGPRLLHIKYRPQRSHEKQPWAFVGKGITFDSGGLDIKPPAGMKLMKKDMGGSAAIVAFAWWCIQSKLPQAIDFYIPMAENAVGSKSFRPGDILVSRSGLKIEITNTDAEGRLVLADALDVAATQEGKDKPSLIINLATLTGAIKVGLGAQLAGLFSNNVSLRDQLFKASSAAGDLCWPMPLYQDYRSSMGSAVADMTNSVEGFGGAVTAALFLESFVKEIPWAHLDIYSWKDSPGGAHLEAGGSGQGVQLLAHWALSRLK